MNCCIIQILFVYSIKDKLLFIIESALEHGKRLAVFGFVYKSLGLLMERYSGNVHPIQTLIAAIAGGYFAFGTNTKIAMQVMHKLLMIINNLFYD